MTNPAEEYRLKALACEKYGREATDSETRIAWAEIMVEWHALASRVAGDRRLEKPSAAYVSID
jgi:hypothetical protein